ncbi:hypothetical protein OPQ81_009150 [Rhizoctonia solani]|nr:hypothetical protein OPQ81_009150 [Rhizoctonia solani]
MSTLPPRSSTGCLTCKCRRKKCDETKPNCLRCQKSGNEMPWKKVKGLSQATSLDASSSCSAELQPFDWVRNDAGSIGVSNESLDLTRMPNSSGSLESLDSWSNPVHEDTFGGCHFQSTVGVPPIPLSSTRGSISMTSGQASLFNAIFSLSNGPDLPYVSTEAVVTPYRTSSSLGGSMWPSPNTEEDDSSSEEDDPEGIGQIICQPLALDPNVESNALPFVLQNYATWVTRVAYEPLKMARFARSFVMKHFEDSVESRWTLTLLANIGGQLGRRVSIDSTYIAMISNLRAEVRWRLANARSIVNDEIGRRKSIQLLDAALETIVIHLFTSPLGEWLPIWNEAAPLFRRLCPEPPGSPINLPSILQQPDISLRHYVHMDVLCSAVMDIPMHFRYDCTPQNTQPICELEGELQVESGIQWLHGTPDRFLAMFAKINAMREDGWAPTPEIISVFEHGIQEFQPTQGKSCDSLLSVARLVVQESWRQAAYVYLYMGLCGDSSDTPRVKRAFKQFMKLLDGTKPGRMPDEFLAMQLLLMAPAAQNKRDRDMIRTRIQRVRVNGPNHGANAKMSIIEDRWARADAEGRPIMWSDNSQARGRVVGI